MFFAGSTLPDDAANPWRYQLDQFAQDQQRVLAALAYGFHQQWPDKSQYLGLDLQPTPHFICCDPTVIARLNEQVNHRIQELVGILNGYDPATEVAIFVIGPAQFKLLFFQPEPNPETCFQQLGLAINVLSQQLETALKNTLTG
ncbi:MAG: hypothetical protein RLZZ435_1942 [Cyanobacteriota bacterium]